MQLFLPRYLNLFWCIRIWHAERDAGAQLCSGLSHADIACAREGHRQPDGASRRQSQGHKRSAAGRVGALYGRAGHTDKHRHDANNAPDAAQPQADRDARGGGKRGH